MRLKKILLVNRGEPRKSSGLDQAVSIASMTGASLLVLGAIRTGFTLPVGIGTDAEDLNKMTEKTMLDKIEGLVRPVRRKGIPVTVKTSVGKPFIEVIREVIHGRYDLVMIPARRSTNLRRMLFGGTEMHLIRKCPCPVWVIKPKQKVPCTRILAAVGPNLGDDVELELDNAIINLASAVTRLDEGRLHILHAWNLYGESILRGSFGHMKPKEVNKLLRQEFIQHKKNLMELIERHSLNEKNLEVHLLKGTAADIIARVARRKRIDLLVMGTVSRTGIAGVIIGNTAEDILGQVDCSVLAVKPTGFVTPVNI